MSNLNLEIMGKELNTTHFTAQESEMLNKILRLTTDMKTNHPEIECFLAELPGTIPNEKNPKVFLKELEDHYESLNKILQRYLRENKH